ncbi:MAG: hypothetical protein KBD46_00950 [Candidatus Levybacteria bacterium]|nr:hypothetical protein [Candidatus Levybacteria bacterium]
MQQTTIAKQPFLHRLAGFTISKRQRFVISVVLLSLGLFFSETYRQFHFYISFLLSSLTVLAIFWSNYKDIRENHSPMIYVLPFFFTLSFGLFYFLLGDRILSRLLLTTCYAIGLYSLFLSQNIFIVSSIRTIALLSSARLVSTVLVLVTFVFLTATIFSLRLFLFPTAILVFLYSFFLISHALWIYTLETSWFPNAKWTAFLSLCIFEVTLILWFWPAHFAFIAVFLMGFLYTLVSLSHLWFEKKLFKGSLWEYVWISLVIFIILLFFTFVLPLGY